MIEKVTLLSFWQKVCTLVILICYAPTLEAAENYVGVHIETHPGLMHQFICNLPENDALSWQAYLYLQLQDFEKANTYFYQLAEKNDPRGYRGLADSYLAGQGFTKDEDLALVLYEKAAALGCGPAQVNAAVIYADRKQWEKAKAWFDLALTNPELTHMRESLEKLYQRRLDGHS